MVLDIFKENFPFPFLIFSVFRGGVCSREGRAQIQKSWESPTLSKVGFEDTQLKYYKIAFIVLIQDITKNTHFKDT